MNGKKKKGKKKKGNQSKHSGSIFIAEDVNRTKPDDSLSNVEVLPHNYHDDAPVQNNHSGVPSNADIQSVGVSESDVDQEKRTNLEAKCVELQEEINKLEVEKNIWSQKEGSLEERIKLLQNEVDSCIQKEGSLEERVKLLQNDMDSCIQKEGSLEERVKLLQNDMDSCIQKEGSLEERVKLLQNNTDSCIQKEGSLEEKVKLLQNDMDSCIQKEVMELKVSGDSLAQENKQLTDSMSALESRIQHLEIVASFYASSKIHVEERSHLKAVEASSKPNMLNEDPSEKDQESEIHIEAVLLASEKTINHSSTMKSSSSTDHASLESNEEIETMEKTNDSFSVTCIEEIGSMEQSQQIQLLGLDDDDSRLSEDVISVPLDDIILELQTTDEKIEAEPVVSLSDAPLIGAPFRLISFVARFVSGADLVDQDKPKPDR